MKELKIKLTQEMLQGLFEGKRLEQNWHQGDGDVMRVVIYPDRYGVFLTHEEMAEIRNQIRADATQEVMERMWGEPEPITIKDSKQ